jgi:hypothetical protein
MPQDPMIHASAAGMYPGKLGCSKLSSKVGEESCGIYASLEKAIAMLEIFIEQNSVRSFRV